MALQLEPALGQRAGAGWRQEREIGSNREGQRGQWPWILQKHSFGVFLEAVLPKPIGILSSWFLLNPFIILRMGQSVSGIHKYSHSTHWLKHFTV